MRGSDQGDRSVAAGEAPVSLGDGLRQAFESLGLGAQLTEHRILSLWESVVAERLGAELAGGAKAEGIQNGVLSVTVSSDALRHRLLLERLTLCDILNQAVGSQVITDIRFSNLRRR